MPDDENLPYDLKNGRYRRIYSGFLRGRRINAVSMEAEAAFWRFHSVADDYGNLQDDDLGLRCDAFPRREVATESVAAWRDELVDSGLLTRYTVDGEAFLHVTDWEWLQPKPRNGRQVRIHPSEPTPLCGGRESDPKATPGAAETRPTGTDQPAETRVVPDEPAETRGRLDGAKNSPDGSGGPPGSPGESGGTRAPSSSPSPRRPPNPPPSGGRPAGAADADSEKPGTGPPLDAVKQAVVVVFELENTTAQDRRRVKRQAEQFAQRLPADADPKEWLLRAAHAQARLWPDKPVTPESVNKHWGQLRKPTPSNKPAPAVKTGVAALAPADAEALYQEVCEADPGLKAYGRGAAPVKQAMNRRLRENAA